MLTTEYSADVQTHPRRWKSTYIFASPSFSHQDILIFGGERLRTTRYVFILFPPRGRSKMPPRTEKQVRCNVVSKPNLPSNPSTDPCFRNGSVRPSVPICRRKTRATRRILMLTYIRTQYCCLYSSPRTGTNEHQGPSRTFVVSSRTSNQQGQQQKAQFHARCIPALVL